MAVGCGYHRLPRRIKEAGQDQADREVVRLNYMGVRHAAGPDAFLQAPWQKGLADQEGVHLV